jgi:hypothetical protein
MTKTIDDNEGRAGAAWSPETIMAARLILAAAVIIVTLWVVVDALQALRDRWSRFISRPY